VKKSLKFSINDMNPPVLPPGGALNWKSAGKWV